MKKKMTTQEFIEKAKLVHGNRYDYSLVDYVHSKTKVIIICPIHGEFLQKPAQHLSGSNCPECVKKNRFYDKDIFIQKAKLVHGEKYDYSLVNYTNSSSHVKIICPTHDVFLQLPSHHLNGQGCPLCGVERRSNLQKSNTEEFIEKAKLVHGNRYDYSLVDYKGSEEKVIIICKEHGEFTQTPNNHLHGNNCPKCDDRYITTEKFIEKAKLVHGDRYDYSKTVYENAKSKVTIICPIHGEFQQRYFHHLRGSGCSKCMAESLTSNTEEFIEKAKLVHEDKYDYSKTVYENAKSKVTIICPIHGEFQQAANSHLSGRGCPKCKAEKARNLASLSWVDKYEKGIVYLIECYNEDERFLKVGVSSLTIEERYPSFKSLPYGYILLKEIEGDSEFCYDIEQNVINQCISYFPKKSFTGKNECLNIDEKEYALSLMTTDRL